MTEPIHELPRQDQRTAQEVIADTLVRASIRDGEPRVAVIVDDPDAGTYAVASTSFVDADRAGWCGDRTQTIANGLTQTQAVEVVALLDDAKRRVAERYL